jgi:lambda repressor-like predicted transcriptional regulator
MVLHATFNRAIKEALKKKGWSMRKAAREAGLDSSFLSKVLSGKRNPPSDERIIVSLAQKLDLDPDSLVIYAGRIPAKYQKDLEKPGAIRLLSGARVLPEAERLSPRAKKVKRVVKKELPDELL